jgi:hypothetical protein
VLLGAVIVTFAKVDPPELTALTFGALGTVGGGDALNVNRAVESPRAFDPLIVNWIEDII